MARLSIGKIPLLPLAFSILSATVSGSENPCFCNGLAVYAHYPVEPFLVDPLGRRLGTDPVDGVFLNEMGALYSVGEPSNTTLPTFEGKRKRDPHPVRYIHLIPMQGRYRIHAVGVAAGSYTLEVIAIRGDCTRETTLRKGRTRKGKVDTIGLEYRDGSGDTVPPATWIDYREGTWLNRPGAAITLRADDACSGVALTRVDCDGGEKTGPGLIEMRKEGKFDLVYWSMDNAGNEEPRRKVEVLCDFTPPTVADDYAGGRIASAPVEIRFHAFDEVSGQARVEGTVRHVGDHSFSGDRLRLTEPGTYLIRYQAVDPAGNRSEAKSIELELRKEPWYRRWLPRP